METNEGNKLIMDFMEVKEEWATYDNYGMQEKVYFTKNPFFRTYSYRIPDLSLVAFLKQSKYHSSWDWLMPVISKCLLCWNQFSIRLLTAAITQFDFQEEIEKPLYNIDIDNTFNGVVNFIIWYNGNKNQ